MTPQKNSLIRPLHAIPDDVRKALEENDLIKAYDERPAYQRNDYIGWILRAKRSETREKRIRQMLIELKEGGVYMNMPHPPSRK